jgi:hypothetical protein
MPTSVHCGNCKLVLDEDPSVQPSLRTPCPSCGSTSRMFDCTITEKIGVTTRMIMKAKRQGKGKPFIEQVTGADIQRKTNKQVHLDRVIDREHDVYKEMVTDSETGEIIHQCEEPLTKHQGHGSAKKKL